MPAGVLTVSSPVSERSPGTLEIFCRKALWHHFQETSQAGHFPHLLPLVELKWETQLSQSLKQLYYEENDGFKQFELFFSLPQRKDHKVINNKHKGLMLKMCPNAFLKGVAMFIFRYNRCEALPMVLSISCCRPSYKWSFKDFLLQIKFSPIVFAFTTQFMGEIIE